MTISKGVNALSPFRQAQLLSKLKKVDPALKGICGEYVHFIKTRKSLSASDEEKLARLLNYGEQFTESSSLHKIIVIPRIGTISPWSSKATEIAHNCGLTSVERIERGIAYYLTVETGSNMHNIALLLHDKMTESVIYEEHKAKELFSDEKPRELKQIKIDDGVASLYEANDSYGLALSEDEIQYLFDSYRKLGRDPTDAELMMFSVVNSEHCRHKIFNAEWFVDGKKQSKSLFKNIKNTFEVGGQDVLSAYKDNAAVIAGGEAERFYPDYKSGSYLTVTEPVHIVAKVETHNHPTAVSPVPGAATGVGGEIRDEGATGRGAKPKMGLAGFSVSNLNIPGYGQPWEDNYGKPERIVSALDIMIDGPIGGASYNNEFGRPNLAGYFRTLETTADEDRWGYHKPIMIAGGTGNIMTDHIAKDDLVNGDNLIVLGGPSMLIGLGGGTASSMQTGQSEESLDFASVQRANAEMERRAQEVINACWSLGDSNPIKTIHDVGAGGLSNALPELINDSNLGAKIDLRSIPSAESGLSPMEIWCNESQERYVLGVSETDIKIFEDICQRERCPYAIVGHATTKRHLVVSDPRSNLNPVDIPMDLLFGSAPRMTRKYVSAKKELPQFETASIDLGEVAERVMKLPSVGSKKFLITIGDRSVGGMTARDQMVGPWQVPVSDVAVTTSGFGSRTGEAMAMGEKTPAAIINPAASARMAVGESITNIAAASIKQLQDVKLSANWMAAAGYKDQDQALHEAVTAIGEDFCPALGITIPVGKDSLSMRTVWPENQEEKSVTSPLSLIISAFAPVTDVAKTLTPQLVDTPSRLVLIDLGVGMARLGGSAIAQAYSQIGNQAPDINPDSLKNFFKTVQLLNSEGLLLAYHDRSDGGLFATLCEMMFAGRLGIDIKLSDIEARTVDFLFNEELGAVIQVEEKNSEKIIDTLRASLGNCVREIGSIQAEQSLTIRRNGKIIYENSRKQLEGWWSGTSYQIQRIRDNQSCADEEYSIIQDDTDPGLSPSVNFVLNVKKYKTRPRAAILREQGVNGQVEMAAAFHRAGFEAVDVHLSDLSHQKKSLEDFSVMAVCGGFSYGDVLGAGEGWAKSILYSPSLREQFSDFFARKDTLSLGVCNGCQMLAALSEIIPGAAHWPQFKRNISEQFEARLVSVRINESSSHLFKGMEGSVVPVSVAHGEGRTRFNDESEAQKALDSKLVPMQYVDNRHDVTIKYPYNPNGSPKGITALTSEDGRATIIMPHPERGFLTTQYSWHPQEWGVEGPWFKLFTNAREWVENKS